jgi:hypothetical protein
MAFDVRDTLAGDFRERKQQEVDTFLTASLIKGMKLRPAIRNRVYEYAKSAGRHQPTIFDFRRVFEDFPVYVAVRDKLALRDNAGLATLFPIKRMLQQNFVKQYVQMLEEEEAEIGPRASALLINWPVRTPVAIHNMTPPRGKSRVAMTIDDGEGLRLQLEPLESFCDFILEQWDPEID